MKKPLFILFFITLFCACAGQTSEVQKDLIREDFNMMLENISNNYVYLSDKDVDLQCLKNNYEAKIEQLNNQADVILFFEYLLNEFYDSHISLTTNIRESYRLWSPIYLEFKDNRALIKNVWQSQLSNLETNILGAEILTFNSIPFQEKVDTFPSLCSNKSLPEVKNWIANKVISGKYSEPRILQLKLKNGDITTLDLDQLQFVDNKNLLSSEIRGDVAIIRINNSLGNNQLISAFDKELDNLLDSKGLILDLRNTNSGGNSYVAKGIMSRFIQEELPYQKHAYVESYDGEPALVRSWLEMLGPRGKRYSKPVVVLVGRWTGSMGEGLAVGFDGMKRAMIVGTEMKRLAGSDFDFGFSHLNFGYKLILQKLYHIDGTIREEYIPEYYINQTSLDKDETLEKALELINKQIE